MTCFLLILTAGPADVSGWTEALKTNPGASHKRPEDNFWGFWQKLGKPFRNSGLQLLAETRKAVPEIGTVRSRKVENKDTPNFQ